MIFLLHLFALTLLSRAIGNPCLPSCRLKLCVEVPVDVNLLSEGQTSHFVCYHGSAIGTANSGAFQVFNNSDSSLSTINSVPSHAFKTLTSRNRSASISLESIPDEKRELLHGKCIVLSIRSAQVLSSEGNVVENLNLSKNPKVNCVSFMTTNNRDATVSPTSTDDPESIEPTKTPSFTQTIGTTFTPTPMEPTFSATFTPFAEVSAEPSPSFESQTTDPSPSSTPGVSQFIPENTKTTTSPTPSGTSFVTDSLGPTSSFEPGDVEEEFKERTFRSSLNFTESHTISSSDPEYPGEYSYSFNGTLRSAGVISLSAVKDDITFLRCFDNSSAIIRLSEQFESGNMLSYFPIGALLVIDRSEFGECNFFPDAQESLRLPAHRRNQSDEFPDRSSEFSDGFLIVEKVQTAANGVMVLGLPTSYAAAFSKASISIERIESETSSKTLGASREASGTSVSNMTSLVRPMTPTFDFDISASILKASGSLGANIDGKFESYRTNWDLSTLTVDSELIFSVDFSVQASLSVSLEVGVSSGQKELKNLLSIPIEGIPVPPKLVHKLKHVNKHWSLPPLRLGLYFEIPAVGSVSADLKVPLIKTGDFIYSIGKRTIMVYAKGPMNNINGGVKTISSEAATWNAPSFGEILQIDDEPPFFSLSAFVGFRPQIAVYLVFLEARVSINVGLNVEGDVILSSDDSFPPNSGVSAPLMYGYCDTCHKARAVASFFLGNAEVMAFLGLRLYLSSLLGVKIGWSKSATLPGNPSFTLPLVKACSWREFGDDTLTCGEHCCDESLGETCNLGAVRENQCSASPSPTPNPSISASPSVSAKIYTDPHLISFDGLRFDCQGSGEFIMTRSKSLDSEVQARFSGPDSRGSVTVAVALRKSNDTLQFAITKEEDTAVADNGLCKISAFHNGERKTRKSLDEEFHGSIDLTGAVLSAQFSAGPHVQFRLAYSETFGCFLESLTVIVPSGGDWEGLLGTPNDDITDDWRSRQGTVLNMMDSTDALLFEPSYDFCTKNWCLRKSEESIFTYEREESFESFMKCDAPYEAIDFSNIPQDVIDVCGENAECIIDGIVGGVGDARNTLRVQEEDRSFTPRPLPSQLPSETTPPSPPPVPTVTFSPIPFPSNYSFVYSTGMYFPEEGSKPIRIVNTTVIFEDPTVNPSFYLVSRNITSFDSDEDYDYFDEIYDAFSCTFRNDALPVERSLDGGRVIFSLEIEFPKSINSLFIDIEKIVEYSGRASFVSEDGKLVTMKVQEYWMNGTSADLTVITKEAKEIEFKQSTTTYICQEVVDWMASERHYSLSGSCDNC